ncbi:non-heme iron oxygenase ferredoxin subunit [bacterium]|nr:MAG: non-heme iron oxygenase ferredoxin subunit [bacterium]
MVKTLVAKITDIAPGTTKQVVLDREEILLCNVDGTVYAISDVCTHDGGNLDQGRLDGCEIECPRHGARFDVRSGEVLALPAVMPVATYRVSREGDDLFLEA